MTGLWELARYEPRTEVLTPGESLRTAYEGSVVYLADPRADHDPPLRRHGMLHPARMPKAHRGLDHRDEFEREAEFVGQPDVARSARAE